MENDLISRIKNHEGFRLYPYVDATGNITIGYGRNLTGKGITDLEAEMMFQHDLEEAIQDYQCLPNSVKRNLNDVRRDVLVEMIFQLGFLGVLKFRKMLAAIGDNDFEAAANEMLKSRWYQQTPSRCRELSERMRNGK